ncbi:MAG: Rieske (2Fe-2S) protein [Planctomycetota bacterium]|jgi:nitrite reductase/ring-hydroxylating ferredoxin subunit
MPDWFAVAEAAQVATETGLTVFAGDVEVAVFRTADGWRAIEGRCPHKGASLGNGSVADGCVACPLHGWQFRLDNGQAIDRPGASVAVITVREIEGRLEIDRESLPKRDAPHAAENNDGIQRFLVRYGALGWVGRFGTVDGVDCRFRDRVVVQTERGLELGEVLADPADRSSAGIGKPAGEVVRVAAVDEMRQFDSRRRTLNSVLISAAADALAEAALPLEIVDGELLFDGESAVLYFLGESHPDAGPLMTDVARQHGLNRIELCPMIDPPASGCGSCGCGHDGGDGCGA